MKVLFVFIIISFSFNCFSIYCPCKYIDIKIKKNKAYENKDYVVFDILIKNNGKDSLIFLLDYKYKINEQLFGYADSVNSDTLVISLFNKSYSSKYKHYPHVDVAHETTGDKKGVSGYYYPKSSVFHLCKREKKKISIMAKKINVENVKHVKIVFFSHEIGKNENVDVCYYWYFKVLNMKYNKWHKTDCFKLC
jgi:hypothetical protein